MRLIQSDEPLPNPVDRIELIAGENDWAFERSGLDEITLSVTGGMADYQVSFSWMPQMEAIHLAAAFDLRVAVAREIEVMRLIALINAQMWMGHFDLWRDAGLMMFRHTLLLAGGPPATNEQIAALLGAATTACDRYYQAFQFVIWAGRTAAESLQSVLFETVGEA